MTTLLSFILNNKKLLIFVGAILVAFTMTVQCSTIRELKQTNKVNENNIKALTENIRTYENRAGQWGVERRALVGEAEQVSKLNEELSEAIRAERGRVQTLTTLVATLRNTTSGNITVTDTIYPSVNGDVNVPLQWKDDWTIITATNRFRINVSNMGQVSVSGYTVDSLYYSMNIPMNVGIRRENKNDWIIFANSPNPNLNIEQIQGFIVPNSTFTQPKPKRIGIGFQLGYGASKDGLSPYMGVGISYNLFNF
jgi:hypothetical protein